MESARNDWTELDTDLDAAEVSSEPQTFLEHAARFAAGDNRPTCYACKGSKVFRSKFTGRVVGPCFSCQGSGKVSPQAAKSHATREANAQAKLDRINAFKLQHADLLAYLTPRADRWQFAANCLRALTDMTPNQLAAAYRCMEQDAARDKARQAAIVASEPQGNGLDLSSLPAGRYAVPGSDSRLKVKIEKPAAPSRYAGWIFVKDAAEYGHGNNYGRQAPGKTYSGKIQSELQAILADPKAAAAAYGKLTGTCGVCGRHLEDAESIARGIGPVCASRL